MTRYQRSPSSLLRRFPRQFPRTRRIDQNVGSFIPQEEDIVDSLGFGRSLVMRALSKVSAVSSCLNTREQFEGMITDVIVRCIHRYRVFCDKSEFLRITRASMQRRILDNFRNMFRQKRWGFEVAFVEESDDNSVSTVASVNHHTISIANSADLVTEFSTDELELRELLEKFEEHLSPEAYQLLLSLFHEDTTVAECQSSPFYQELLSILPRLGNLGLFSSRYFQLKTAV